MGTTIVQHTFPIAVANKVPMIGAVSGGAFLRSPYSRYAVNYRASSTDEIAAMVNMFVVRMYLSRVSVFYQNDALGKNGYEGVRLALRAHRLVPHSEGTYDGSAMIMQPGVDALKASSEPEAVIMIGASAPLAAFVRKAKKLWPKAVFATCSSTGNVFAEALGSPEMRANVFVTQVVPLPDDISVPVVRDYQAALKAFDPTASFSTLSLEGYIIGRMSAEVVARTARTGNLTREAFLDVIYDNAMVNVGGLRLGPFGGACEDKAGWCRCNQGQHHVYGSKVLGNGGFAYYTDLDLTFATCGYQVQTTHDIVLGQTADFSGGVDGVGVAMRDGMRAAFEQANTDQVVGGAEVKLISRDDEGSPAVSVDNMRKLIQDDRVFAIVGSLGISTATATLPVALESGVPVIGLAVGSRSAHVPFSSTVINIRASEVDETAAIVDYYVRLGLKRLAVFSEFGERGISARSAVDIAARAHGLSIFSVANYDEVASEVEEGFATLRSFGAPDAVVMFGDPVFLAKFLRLAKAAWPECHFAVTSVVVGEVMASLLETPDLRRNVLLTSVVPLPTDTSYEIVKSYQLAMRSYNSSLLVSSLSLEGFIVATFILKVLQMCPVIARLALLEKIYEHSNIAVASNMDVGPFTQPSGEEEGCNSGMRFVFLTRLLANGTFGYVDDNYRFDFSGSCGMQNPLCTRGFYRSSPEKVCQFCGEGHHTNGTSCLLCPAGFFCTESYMDPKHCPDVQRCPSGSTRPCPDNMHLRDGACRNSTSETAMYRILAGVIAAVAAVFLFMVVLCVLKRRRVTIEACKDQLARALDVENEMSKKTTSTMRLRMLGVSSSAIAEFTKETRAKQSLQSGVSICYLMSEAFAELALEKSGINDPSFYDLKDSFFFGENPLGGDVICPRDGKPGAALVDWLPRHHRGKCTHFLSWIWSYKVSLVQQALQHWLDTTLTVNADEVFLYMCFFVNNQYRILVNDEMTGSDELGRVFETNLSRIGRVIAMLDTWDHPVYLTRIWTIFEQVTAVKLDIPVTMIMPKVAAESLLEQIEQGTEGIVRVKNALTNVSSSGAKAFSIKDEIAVKRLIEQSFGFDHVDKKIKNCMIEWVGGMIETHIRNLVMTGKDSALGYTVNRCLASRNLGEQQQQQIRLARSRCEYLGSSSMAVGAHDSETSTQSRRPKYDRSSSASWAHDSETATEVRPQQQSSSISIPASGPSGGHLACNDRDAKVYDV